MSDLMLSEFILCLLPLIAGIFLFKDAPPLPPSQSTKLKLDKVSTVPENLPDSYLPKHRRKLNSRKRISVRL